ncbi:hotdog fold thioesterase [Halotalea alkalilenta]|uniref:Esterase n=1 Tax=Halotalea alkalilenta TaxID=376489 RepID=A0A172YBQ4_9GAMM|nr:hotdog fold thioesterase [Halotalea alkalilenta]ANF56542.1 esterase [Halotalea alkalilenta]
MGFWRTRPDLDRLNEMQRGNLGEHLDIRFEAVDDDSITASMVVDSRTHQPFGLLHGGASVTLAETLGSCASYYCIDHDHESCVGLEINASHLRAVSRGRVTAVARPLRIGHSIHVWDIQLHDDRGRTTCVARLSVAVIGAKR